MAKIPKLPKLSVADTLKIFTTVPKKFIDDFFRFMKLDKDIQSDFFIDIEKLASWLNVDKYTISKSLTRSYQEGVDYIKKPYTVSTSKYGNHRKHILLTSDCMKRICMASRSSKAEMVRSYFIEIEEFVIHYNDQIVDGLMREIQELAIKTERHKAMMARELST